MANLIETNQWENGIYQLETADPVMGGPNGIDNRQPQQLANRTLWLKNQIADAVQSINVNKQWASDELGKKSDKTINITAGNGLSGGGTLATNRTISLGTPSKITASSTNSVAATTHTHEIDKASPTLAGVLKVLDVLTSTDGLAALSAKQGKVLADRIAKVAAGSFNFCGELGERNLDDITGANPNNYGVWHQTLNSYATAARGYPVQKAGVLLMLPAAYSGLQIYIPFDENVIIKRTTVATNVYQAWQFIGSDKLGKSGEQELNGMLSIRNSNWSKITFPAAEGKWQLGLNPNAGSRTSGVDARKRFNFVFTPSIGSAAYLQFDDIGSGETVAYQSWVNNSIKSAEVPSGMVVFFAGATAPKGWLKANGAAVSRTTYAALFAAIGTRYGKGNGTTTFNLPDLRGEFIRSWDDGRGVDGGRVLGSAQGDAIRNITGRMDSGTRDNAEFIDDLHVSGAFAIIPGNKWWTADGIAGSNPAGVTFDASRVVPTAAENRPRNVALLACIKI